MDTLTLSTRLLNEYGLPNQCQIEQATKAVRLRMYRMDDQTVLNHITMSKFGFKVGELIITFNKKSR